MTMFSCFMPQGFIDISIPWGDENCAIPKIFECLRSKSSILQSYLIYLHSETLINLVQNADISTLNFNVQILRGSPDDLISELTEVFTEYLRRSSKNETSALFECEVNERKIDIDVHWNFVIWSECTATNLCMSVNGTETLSVYEPVHSAKFSQILTCLQDIQNRCIVPLVTFDEAKASREDYLRYLHLLLFISNHRNWTVKPHPITGEIPWLPTDTASVYIQPDLKLTSISELLKSTTTVTLIKNEEEYRKLKGEESSWIVRLSKVIDLDALMIVEPENVKLPKIFEDITIIVSTGESVYYLDKNLGLLLNIKKSQPKDVCVIRQVYYQEGEVYLFSTKSISAYIRRLLESESRIQITEGTIEDEETMIKEIKERYE